MHASRPKLVNDPVHGMIVLPAWAQPVVATPLFQRLGRVSQMGSLQKVWPGATHTRLEHSLGTMHLGLRWSAHLGLDDRSTRALGLASLLHDIAHGPFSHIFEAAIQGTPAAAWYGDHDRFRYALLREPALAAALGDAADDVQRVWQGAPDAAANVSTTNLAVPPRETAAFVIGAANCGDTSGWTHIGLGAVTDARDSTPDMVCAGWGAVTDTSAPNWVLLHALLAGVAGVDRMDYLLRDSYHLTPQRRLHITCIESIMHESFLADGQLAFSAKGARYIATLLEERAYMYREVYTHAKSCAADALLRHAFIQADLRGAPELASPALFERLDDAWVVARAWVGDAANPACAAHWLLRFLRNQLPAQVEHEGGVPLTTRLDRQAVTAHECAHMVAVKPDGTCAPLYNTLQGLLPLNAVHVQYTFYL